MKLLKESIITKRGKRKLNLEEASKLSDFDRLMKILDSDMLSEDIEKTKSGKWVNRGKEGTHGEFKTKKAAREQQKAMFAQGYKTESINENYSLRYDIEYTDDGDVKSITTIDGKTLELGQKINDDYITKFDLNTNKVYLNKNQNLKNGNDYIIDDVIEYIDTLNEDLTQDILQDLEDKDINYDKDRETEREIKLELAKQGIKTESINENIGQDVSKYQKWVDYDMKKYGKISDATNNYIKKAGLEIIKDQYNNYEVIAKRSVEESLKNDEIDDFFMKAKKLGVKTLKDLESLLHQPESIGKTEKEKMDSYYKETNPNDKQLGLYDESLYQSLSLSGNKMTFQIEDDGTFIVKDGDKEIVNAKITDPESVREQISSMFNVETLKEDINIQKSEETPTPENTGMSQLLIDAINGEWDTIKLYNDIMVNAESYGYSDIADVLRDIIAEENIHVGQLQTALETISPNVSSIEKGAEEAKQQLNDTQTIEEN